MSPLREIDCSEPLFRPIKVKGRRTFIRTREEAAQFILELPSGRQHRQPWIAAGKALKDGAPITHVHWYVVRALSSDGVLG